MSTTAKHPPVEPGLISVIMPSYNAAHYLAEAVASVMTQTYTQVELIIIDDGSRDESVDIAQSLVDAHPGRILLLEQANNGPYPARNLGLCRARGEFIAFLDADDWWSPDCLAKLHAALTTSPAILAYCGWQNSGPGAPGTAPYIPPDFSVGDATTAFLRSCPWPIHAALVRRTAIDAVKGFSVRCFSSMDYDLWLRLFAHDQRLIRVAEVLAFYRWHDHGQISKTKWKQVLDARTVRQDFIDQNPALIAGLDAAALQRLVDEPILKEAYRAYWKRDLVSARKLFREAFALRAWRVADLKYLLPTLLPERLYQVIITTIDRQPRPR